MNRNLTTALVAAGALVMTAVATTAFLRGRHAGTPEFAVAVLEADAEMPPGEAEQALILRVAPVSDREPRYAGVISSEPVRETRLVDAAAAGSCTARARQEASPAAAACAEPGQVTLTRVIGYDVVYRNPDGSTGSLRVNDKPATRLRIGNIEQGSYDVTYRYKDEERTLRTYRAPEGTHLPVVDGKVVIRFENWVGRQ